MKGQQHNDELTGDESLEELEQWLDRQAAAGEVDEPLPAADETTIETDLKADDANLTDTTTDSVTVEADSSESEAQAILSKDGKHTIPFDVLQSERTKNQTLQQRIAELEATLPTADKNARLIEMRNKQLTKLGVELEDLPEDINVSDEELAQLEEDYPELARPMRALAAKISALESTKTAPTATEQIDVNQLIQSIPELDAMRNENGDDWQSAMQLDDQLRADPAWQAKPMSERFSEVARRVAQNKQSAQQSSAALAAQQAIDNAANQLPNSPSEIGSTNSHELSPKEFLETASAAQLQARFMTMTTAEMEAFIEQGGSY